MNKPLSPQLTFEEKVRTAQEAMRRAIARAGLQNDPYGAVIETASDGIGLIVEADARIEATLERLQQPADLPALTQAVAGAAREAFRRESEWQRAQAAEAAGRAARKELWRWSAITAGLMALAALVAGVAVWRWQGQEVAALQTHMNGVQRAAFSDGQENARTWTALMSYNHLRDLLGAGCREVVVDGRRGCDTRMWIDPPTRAGS